MSGVIFFLKISVQVKKKEIISSNSVPQKKDEILEDGLSRIQQHMEFIFGELMTRIEKLETRFDGGRSKKDREAKKGGECC